VITIREGYGAYVAPKWVRPTVERLLSSLDSSHVTGLSGIVLTDAVQSTNGGQGNRSQRQVTLGKYYRRRNGEPAWIELTVDEILKQFRAPFDKLQYSRDLVIARVLYHELGHHLHATRRGIGRAPESSAEAWQTRLSRIHFSPLWLPQARTPVAATRSTNAKGLHSPPPPRSLRDAHLIVVNAADAPTELEEPQSSRARVGVLKLFLEYYNHARPHQSLGGVSPVARRDGYFAQAEA
jgi:hypothetical protein